MTRLADVFIAFVMGALFATCIFVASPSNADTEKRIKVYGTDEYGIKKPFPEMEIVEDYENNKVEYFNYKDGVKEAFPSTVIEVDKPSKRHYNDASFFGKIFKEED